MDHSAETSLEFLQARWPRSAAWLDRTEAFTQARDELLMEGHALDEVLGAAILMIMEHRIRVGDFDDEELARRAKNYISFYEENESSPFPPEDTISVTDLRRCIEEIHDGWTDQVVARARSQIRIDNPELVDVASPEHGRVLVVKEHVDPSEVQRAGFMGLGFGLMPIRQGLPPLPFVALVYENAYFGRRMFSKIASWVDDPTHRRDAQNIVVTFVDEPDGGYSFYLYPNPDVIEKRNQDDPKVVVMILFPLYKKRFNRDSRHPFDQFKSLLNANQFILCGGDTKGNLFIDTMILKDSLRTLCRNQTGPNDVEYEERFEKESSGHSPE